MRNKLDAIILISLFAIGILGYADQYVIPANHVRFAIMDCTQDGGDSATCAKTAQASKGTPLTRNLGI